LEKMSRGRGSEVVGAGVSVASDDDDDVRGIRMIVPHELESVGEGYQQQREEEEEERSQIAELARPRTPEPIGLGMTQIPLEDDEEPRRQSSPPPTHSVIDQLFEHLSTLSNQLESAVELSSLLQAQHATVQSTIFALESR
jgi:hypothetical protein